MCHGQYLSLFTIVVNVIRYVASIICGGSLLKGKRYKRRGLKNFHNKAIQTKIHLFINKYIVNRLISLVGRVFANGPGDLGLIPGRVIPKTLKMVLDTALPYKVRIKGKVEQSRERSSALPYTLIHGVVAIEKGAFWSSSTTVANFTYFTNVQNLVLQIFVYVCVCEQLLSRCPIGLCAFW